MKKADEMVSEGLENAIKEDRAIDYCLGRVYENLVIQHKQEDATGDTDLTKRVDHNIELAEYSIIRIEALQNYAREP